MTNSCLTALPLLQLKQISIQRREVPILSSFSLSLSPSNIVWVLGANGVGKTTLLKVTAGLLTPDSGEVLWSGIPFNHARSEKCIDLHYIGHTNGIKLGLSVEENLYLTQAILNKPTQCTVEEALSTVGLLSKCNAFARDLSAGQQRRLAIARLCFLPAKVWIIDEPFTAMDEQGISVMAALFKAQLDRGGGIVASTHRLFSESENFTATQQQFITLTRAADATIL